MVVAGLVLVVLGLLVALSEVHAPSHGIAGGIGVVLAAIGVTLALAGAGANAAIGVGAGLALAAGGGAGVTVVARRALAVRQRRVKTGPEALIGTLGTVRRWEGEEGTIALQGSIWRARRSLAIDEDDDPGPELRPGDQVVVERLRGLTVSVRPAEAWELL